MNVAVNYAKGIAIILMVLLHSSRWIESSYFGHIICMFHMPLFFIMSGFCFKKKYLDDFKNFVVKRIKGLWWPYVKYGFLFLLFHNVFFHLHIYDSIYGSYTGQTSSLYDIKDFILQMQRILRMVSTEQLLSGFWFLPALFYASIIAYIIIRYIHNRILGGAVLISFVLGFLAFDFKVPFLGIDNKMLLGALFFYFGFCWKDNINLFESVRNNAIFSMFAIVLTIIMAWKIPVSMPTMKLIYVVPYMFTAIFASVFIYLSCLCLAKFNTPVGTFLNYIGMHTIEILTWHFLFFKLVSLIIVKIYKLPLNTIASFPSIQEYSSEGWWMAYTLVGVLLPVMLICMINKISKI